MTNGLVQHITVEESITGKQCYLLRSSGSKSGSQTIEVYQMQIMYSKSCHAGPGLNDLGLVSQSIIHLTVLQIRRGKRNDLRIIFHTFPLKHIL